MKKDRIIFSGMILVDMILILAGFIISPDKRASIIGKYYAHTEQDAALRKTYIQKI